MRSSRTSMTVLNFVSRVRTVSIAFTGYSVCRRFMLERVFEAISSNQNSDGGWGSVQGKQSNTEATSFALLALDSSKNKSATAKINPGLAWLLRHQNGDGS